MFKSLSFTVFTVLFLLLSDFNCVVVLAQEPAKPYSWQEMKDSSKFYEKARDYGSALNWCEQALASACKELGEMDTIVADLAGKLTYLSWQLRKYELALKYARMDSTIRIQAQGPDHPAFVILYKNLGAQYDGLNDFADAESSYKHSVEIARKLYKTDDADLASSISSLAVFYYNRGKYSQAEPLYKESLEMKRRIFKEDNPSLALSINNNAAFYINIGRYNEADTLFKEALAMNRRLYNEDHPELARSINNLAYFYYTRGNLAEAEPLYKEGLEMGRRIYQTDNPYLAAMIFQVANFSFSAGNFNEAESLYKEALAMRRHLYKGDHPDLAISINDLGGFYERIGNYNEAETLIKEAYAMRKRIYRGDHPELANSLNDMAALYKDKGDYSEAEPLLKEALAMRKRIFKGDHTVVAKTLSNLGIFYKLIGNIREAEPLYKEALAMRQRLFKGDHPDLAVSINNMGVFYNEIGNFDETELLYKEALAMRRRLFKGDNPDLAVSINNLGFFYNEKGKYSEAEPLFKEALAMRRRMFKTDNPDLAQSINNIAFYYMNVGNYTEAEPLFIEALAMSRRLFMDDNPDLSQSMINLAFLYYKTGRNSDAVPLYEEALAMRRRLYKNDHQDLAATINDLAIVLGTSGNHSDAERLLRESMDMYRNVFNNQSANLSENEKDKYWNTMKGKFELLLNYTLLNKKETTEILGYTYDNLLFTKGILAYSTKKMKERILSCNDSNATGLFIKWSDLKMFISKHSTLTANELIKKRINLDSLEAIANNLEKELSQMSSSFASEVKLKYFTWQDVQKSLKKNEAAVEIVRFRRSDMKGNTDSVCYGFLIVKPGKSGNSIKFVINQDGRSLENNFAKQYISDLNKKIRNENYYDQYWAKIAANLKGVKKAYISPDGVYNQLNLATLFNPVTKKYLIDELDLQLVTSTRDIINQSPNEKYDNTAVLIGNPLFKIEKPEDIKIKANTESKLSDDYYLSEEAELTMRSGIYPLPATGVEIGKIASLLADRKWKVDIFTQEMAIEDAVKKANSPRVLHIATHGKFLSDIDRTSSVFGGSFDKQKAGGNPLLRSFLVFAGADSPDSIKKKLNNDDGFLTAYEAMNLNLDKTELVVLSACETGLGEIRNGEGVYGLQRAFIQAGAKTVIMSLWSVSDEATQELMSIFYKEWLGGKAKRDAFRTAQMKLKEKYPSPYYWGAFVMVGE